MVIDSLLREGWAGAGGAVRWWEGLQPSNICLSQSNPCPSYQCHFYWLAFFLFFLLFFFFFLQGRPHKIFQLAGTNCNPHTIWEAEMQLDSRTCKAKKTVQMDQKWEQGFFCLFVCFEVNLEEDFFPPSSSPFFFPSVKPNHLSQAPPLLLRRWLKTITSRLGFPPHPLFWLK